MPLKQMAKDVDQFQAAANGMDESVKIGPLLVFPMKTNARIMAEEAVDGFVDLLETEPELAKKEMVDLLTDALVSAALLTMFADTIDKV